MNQQVVVTGIGVISPVGIGKSNYWNSILDGCSGIKEVKSFDTSGYRIHNAAEIYDFYPDEHLHDVDTKGLERAGHLGLSATKLALQDASMSSDFLKNKRSAVIIGTTCATLQSFEKLHEEWIKNGLGAVDKDLFTEWFHPNIPWAISKSLQINGPSEIVVTACSAGAYAIGQAFEHVRAGRCKVAIAGGVEAMIKIAFCGFQSTRSLEKECCKPFDKKRSGLMLGESAAILILEEAESARQRGAHIYAEISGYGLSCDAHHMTAPDPTGSGASLAMKNALQRAQIAPEKVDYICAHGTGTPLNDAMETKAIKLIFGQKAYTIPISSIKSMVGHTLGAAGALNAVSAILAIDSGKVPPTINYQEPDPVCDLDYVPNQNRKTEVNVALSNSFAFGGNNSALVVNRFSREDSEQWMIAS